MRTNRRQMLKRVGAALATAPVLLVTQTAPTRAAEPMPDPALAAQHERGKATWDDLMTKRCCADDVLRVTGVTRCEGAVGSVSYAPPGRIVMGSGTAIEGGVVTGGIDIGAGVRDIRLVGCRIDASSWPAIYAAAERD